MNTPLIRVPANHLSTPTAQGLVVLGGRTRPTMVPRFKFGEFRCDGPAIAVPASTNYRAKAANALKPIYLNNKLGCCVIAAGAHRCGLSLANADAGDWIATDDQIVRDYSAIGGYDPSNPTATDNGCDEMTAFEYWRVNGALDGVKLAAYMSVDATNPEECREAIYLFEHLFVGTELPDAWVQKDMPQGNGFTWDIDGDPNPQNGHATLLCDYDTNGDYFLSTWGLVGRLTERANEKYNGASAGGMLTVLLTQDVLARATQRAPNGRDWAGLVQQFQKMGGAIPAAA